MAKGAKLFEFEKGEITTLKRVGKSQRESPKALGCSKTVTCNYLKNPNKHGASKKEKKKRIVRKVKKKTSSTSKILKSLVDAPCSTDGLQKYWHANIFHKRITQQGIF